MGEIIDCFDPSDKEFKFRFTEDTCAQIRTGICQLQGFDSDAVVASHSEYPRCQKILLGLINGTIKDVPCIYKCKCGHWMCVDGQHRICIAQKRGMTLKVEIEKCDEYCMVCQPSIHNVNEKDGIGEIVVELDIKNSM